jgi:hypothetical protein
MHLRPIRKESASSRSGDNVVLSRVCDRGMRNRSSYERRNINRQLPDIDAGLIAELESTSQRAVGRLG